MINRLRLFAALMLVGCGEAIRAVGWRVWGEGRKP